MTSPLRLAFVTHAGPAVGLGHVGRCLALAAAWAPEGAGMLFLLSPDERAAQRLARAGAELSQRGARRADVEEAPWEAEPAEARRRLSRFGPDVIVVDSYAAAPDFLASLAEVAGQVAAVDDLADRWLPVNVVVNGGIVAETLRYRARPDTVFLLGPRYALIDPRFTEAPARAARPRVERALVALGGGRHDATVAAALQAVDAVLEDARVDVVVGPFVAPGAEAAGGDRGARNEIVVHHGLGDLRGLMLAADLAVAGAGVTLYELAATGIPTVVVQMADNQTPNADGFARVGAALSAGAADRPDLGRAVEREVRRLAGDPVLRAALGGRARDLVDGRGALRVARELGARAAAERST